jgi:hypothetical protein
MVTELDMRKFQLSTKRKIGPRMNAMGYPLDSGSPNMLGSRP